MTTFVVCTRCGTAQEIAAPDQLPKLWRRTEAGLRCVRCTGKDVGADEGVGDILEEEVIYPGGDTLLDESFEEEKCELCRGPCQGH